MSLDLKKLDKEFDTFLENLTPEKYADYIDSLSILEKISRNKGRFVIDSLDKDKLYLAEMCLLSGKLELNLPDSDIFKTDDGRIKQLQNLHKIEDLPFYKDFGNYLIDKYVGSGEIINMQYFIKHPNYKMTAPHQDGIYFNDIDSDIITFWIPLQDVDETNSTMYYKDWDGTRTLTKHKPIGKNIRNRSGDVGVSQFIEESNLSEYKPVYLKYGQGVVHNQFSEHYSGINKTDNVRYAITCIIKVKNEK